jgi:MFS family permease
MPVFDSVPAWFVLRALTGMTMNGLFVASETWINAVAEERSRGRVIAVYGATLSASFALAPLLVPLTGTEGWPPFLACAGLISLAAIPLLRAGHLSPELAGKASFNIISFLWIAPTLAAAVFLTAFKEMSLGSILPVYGVRNGLSEASAATLLTAAYGGALLLQFPIGWLADHVDRMRLLLVFTVIGLVGTLLLPLMIEAPSVILWLGLGCWVGLFTGIYIVSMTLVGERFKGAELVTANASFGLLWGIGSLFGPAFSGGAMDIWDPNGFPATLGVVTALVLAVMLYRTFRRRPKTRPPS